MKYAIYLNKENRVLSATYEQYATKKAILVDTLPEGNITDYLYINEGYVYDPVIVTPSIASQIATLKQELAEYHYIGVKIAMGVATKEEYADQIAYTETLREQIRELEAQL